MSTRRRVAPPGRYRVAELGSVCLLLFLLFCLLVLSVAMKSPTLDEQNHIARGLAYLKTGDLRLSQEHPPGVNAWETWPLLLDPTVRLPLDSASWANAEWYGFGDRLLWHANDADTRARMVFAARVPVMWLTLILAAQVYRWARALGGRWAGLLALSLLVFDPNILAHGRLTTTDMGLTCLALTAMFALWKALQWRSLHRGRGWLYWLHAGSLFGLAQVSKFSALALGPMIVLVVVMAWLKEVVALRSRHLPGSAGAPGVRTTWQWGVRLALVFAVGFIVIWAVYGFEWGSIALLHDMAGPAPSYFAGIQTILKRTGGGTTAFLMGRYSDSGWWTYFPLAFVVKTPLPTLLLLLAALVLRIGKRIASLYQARTKDRQPGTHPITAHAERGAPPGTLTCLTIPVLAFWAMAMSGSFNIGYRHILPSLPFLYILAGWQIAIHVNRRWNHLPFVIRHPSFVARDLLARGLLLAICTLPLAVSAFSIFPDYLSFFHVLAGGPEDGYRLLVDSNLDWGQDLPGLAARFAEQVDGERVGDGGYVNLSWFGAAYPEAYDLVFHPLPGFWRFAGDPAAYGLNPTNPAPGMYAISASNLQGIQLADRDTFAWFRAQDPLGHVGHSILIYEVPERPSPTQAVVLAVPTTQLAGPERLLLEQGATVRQFDPSSGIIVPAVDTVWFITPVGLDRRELTGWGEVVRQGPGYVVAVSPSGREGQPILEIASRCDLDTQFAGTVALQQCQTGDLTVARGGTEGHGPAGHTLTVEAVWCVIRPPYRAAKSFAHLLNADGTYIAGWDGIAAPATCWQANDRLIQRYTIALPPDLAAGTYQVEIGWYDAETLQRWAYKVDGIQVGDRLLLPDIEIKQ